MQSSCIDDSATILNHRVVGNAFSFSDRSKLAVCGGVQVSCLIDINEPDRFYKENIPISPPFKHYVTSYEWDPHNNTKYIQTRNKIIELVDVEDSRDIGRPLAVYSGHSGAINEAKWSPFKRGLLASCANDSYLYLWNSDFERPVLKENSFGGANCVAWSKTQENIIALTSNNDVKIYDLRKLNTVFRYIPNAHSKRISSIDWCPVEDKFIVAGRDKTVRIWSVGNLHDEKLNPIKIDEFQCWKAKFLPQSTSFIVIPSCLSTLFTNKTLSLSFSKQLSPTTPTSVSTPHLLSQQSEMQTSCRVAICQISGSNQPKLHKYHSNRTDMIVNFDFYFNDDNKSLIAWTKDQYLINFPLDTQYAPLKDLQTKIGDDTTDMPPRMLTSQVSSTNMKLLQQQTIADASSRKSSFSEYGVYGTPPTAFIGMQAVQFAINSSDESAPPIHHNQFPSLTLSSHPKSHAAEIIPYPKCFCAKFSGLPQHLIVFQNKTQNQYKTYPKQYMPQNDKLTERIRHKHKGIIKPSKSRVKLTDKRSRVCIIDVSDLMSIRYDLAAKYMIFNQENRSVSEKNFLAAFNEHRGDLPQVWDLLKFITIHAESISLNPDHGRPWSCTTFGRPLVNYIIENCLRISDIQTTVMVITKLLQYDRNLVPIRSSVQRQRHKEVCETETKSNHSVLQSISQTGRHEDIPILRHTIESERNISGLDNRSYDSSLAAHNRNIGLLDPERHNEFDALIKYYCDLLYRWGLYIKRTELYEFIHDKPPEFDAKFEFSSRCKKCRNKTQGGKCWASDCRPKAHILYCSLCQLTVNGLSITCVMCGHGGHYAHMSDWFKKQDDCAAACGCKCVDYI